MKRMFIAFLICCFMIQLCPVFARSDGATDLPSVETEWAEDDSASLSDVLEDVPVEDSPTEVPFSAEIVLNGQGYQLMGTVDSLPLATAGVRPYYSLNGEDYLVISDSDLVDWNLPPWVPQRKSSSPSSVVSL